MWKCRVFFGEFVQIDFIRIGGLFLNGGLHYEPALFLLFLIATCFANIIECIVFVLGYFQGKTIIAMFTEI